MQKTENKAH